MKSLFFLFFLLSLEASAAVILIDPGHGGEDMGAKALGKSSMKEKDLTLQIATRIQEKLSRKHISYLTRSIDRTVTLVERAEMAEKVKADLFISVHINSNTNPSSHGFETFYLDNHDEVANKKVESVENAGVEGDDKVINQILIDLVIQNTVKSSRKLAQMIHANVANRVGRNFNITNRGVKPGLFYVLALSKRPGVLLEVGFISNKDELKKMASVSFQEAYAKSVSEAIEKYLAATNSKPKFPM